ncbi:hypothetical protein MMC12_007219 [Toensbergia leucococca]|nr:hypothetical protein [Toensbergia leucococca]
MESFIEGIGERYLERKANAIPQQLENLAKKQFKHAANGRTPETSKESKSKSSEQDKEIERLRRQLAATKVSKSNAGSDSVVRSRVLISEAGRESHKSSRQSTNDESRKSHRRESQETRKRLEAGPPKLSQMDMNRLALQHAESSKLPLKVRNLELLASQQNLLDRTTKHGGSAALLHASRAQPGQREALPYSGRTDLEGNPSTKAFRPRRDLCLVEVIEEPDDERHQRSQSARRDVKPNQRTSGGRNGGQVSSEHSAVESGRTAGYRLHRTSQGSVPPRDDGSR